MCFKRRRAAESTLGDTSVQPSLAGFFLQARQQTPEDDDLAMADAIAMTEAEPW